MWLSINVGTSSTTAPAPARGADATIASAAAQSSRIAAPGSRGIECATGPAPVCATAVTQGLPDHERLCLSGPPPSRARPLHWAEHSCDHSSGTWRSFLLLMSESASMTEAEVMFPNRVCHAGRVLFNATPWSILELLAEPTAAAVRPASTRPCPGAPRALLFVGGRLEGAVVAARPSCVRSNECS